MAVKIRYYGGANAGQVLSFGDEVQTITIGRDAQKCQVVFPADDVRVGREHCSLQRTAGRYRLILNGANPVLVNGKDAYHEQMLEAADELQLGREGPKVIVETQRGAELAATIGREKQKGVGTVMGELGKSTRSTRKMTVMVSLMVIALGVMAYCGYIVMQTDVSQTKKQVVNVATQQAAEGRKIEELSKLTANQQASVKDVFSRLASVKKELQTKESSLQEPLEKLKPSVYLVFTQTPHQQEPTGNEMAAGAPMGSTVGTAWVVGKGMLATCAHVADEFNDAAAKGDKMMVRSSETPPKTFEIKSVVIHPGYEAFSKLWEEYKPILRTNDADITRVDSPPACDVGLLMVDEDASLGPAVTLAKDEVLKGLRIGDPIGYCGFPMENQVSQGVNINNPDPIVHVGHLSAIENELFMRGPGSDGMLLKAFLPSVGGSSGSPVIDKEGRVIGVLSAGNFVPVQGADGAILRMDPGGGVTFCQRSDLVRELIDHRADALMPKRLKTWQDNLKQFPSAFTELPKIQLERTLTMWQQKLGGGTHDQIQKISGTTQAPDGGDASSPFSLKHSVDLPGAGSYLIFVSTTNIKDEIILQVYDQADANVLAGDTQASNYVAAALATNGAMTLHALIASGPAAVDYTIQVFKAKDVPSPAPKSTPDTQPATDGDGP